MDLADEASLNWENQVLNTMFDFDKSAKGLSVLVNVARRYVFFTLMNASLKMFHKKPFFVFLLYSMKIGEVIVI